MANAAYSTTIKAVGASTAFTAEPTTTVTANTVYQITNTARRILDPDVAITVEVDADGAGAGAYATAAASSYTVDYLFGTITFTADQGASALVRVSGAYLTLTDVAEATEFSLNLSRTVQDASYFHADGYKRKIATLRDCTGSISQLSLLNAAHGATSFTALYAAGTPFLLEVHPGATGDYFRAWVLLESTTEQSTPEGLYTASFNFTAAAQGTGAAFGFGT